MSFGVSGPGGEASGSGKAGAGHLAARADEDREALNVQGRRRRRLGLLRAAGALGAAAVATATAVHRGGRRKARPVQAQAQAPRERDSPRARAAEAEASRAEGHSVAELREELRGEVEATASALRVEAQQVSASASAAAAAEVHGDMLQRLAGLQQAGLTQDVEDAARRRAEEAVAGMQEGLRQELSELVDRRLAERAITTTAEGGEGSVRAARHSLDGLIRAEAALVRANLEDIVRGEAVEVTAAAAEAAATELREELRQDFAAQLGEEVAAAGAGLRRELGAEVSSRCDELLEATRTAAADATATAGGVERQLVEAEALREELRSNLKSVSGGLRVEMQRMADSITSRVADAEATQAALIAAATAERRKDVAHMECRVNEAVEQAVPREALQEEAATRERQVTELRERVDEYQDTADRRLAAAAVAEAALRDADTSELRAEVAATTAAVREEVQAEVEARSAQATELEKRIAAIAESSERAAEVIGAAAASQAAAADDVARLNTRQDEGAEEMSRLATAHAALSDELERLRKSQSGLTADGATRLEPGGSELTDQVSRFSARQAELAGQHAATAEGVSALSTRMGNAESHISEMGEQVTTLMTAAAAEARNEAAARQRDSTRLEVALHVACEEQRAAIELEAVNRTKALEDEALQRGAQLSALDVRLAAVEEVARAPGRPAEAAAIDSHAQGAEEARQQQVDELSVRVAAIEASSAEVRTATPLQDSAEDSNVGLLVARLEARLAESDSRGREGLTAVEARAGAAAEALSASQTGLTREAAARERQLDDLRERVDDAVEQGAAVEGRLLQEVARLEAKVETAEAKAAAGVASATNGRRRLETRINADADRIERRLQSDSARLEAKLDGESARLDSKVKEASARLEVTVNEASARLEGKVDEASACLESKLDGESARLEGKLDGESARLDGKVNEALARLEAISNEASTRLEAKLDGESARLEGKLDGDSAQLDGKVDEVSTRLEGAVDVMSARLEAKVDGESARLEATVKETVAKLERKTADDAARLEALTGTGIAQLGVEVEERMAKLEDGVGADVARLEQKMLDTTDGIHQKVAQDIARLESKLDVGAANVNAGTERTESASAPATESEAALSRLETKVDGEVARLEAMVEEAGASAFEIAASVESSVRDARTEAAAAATAASAAAEEGRREVARLVDQLGEVRGATATARDNLGAEAEARQRDVVRLENRLNADQVAASESISQLRHRLDSLAAASENIHRAEDAAGQVREVVPDSPAREQALADIRADARITETALTRLVESTAVTTQQAALREARAALAAESADLRRVTHDAIAEIRRELQAEAAERRRSLAELNEGSSAAVAKSARETREVLLDELGRVRSEVALLASSQANLSDVTTEHATALAAEAAGRARLQAAVESAESDALVRHKEAAEAKASAATLRARLEGLVAEVEALRAARGAAVRPGRSNSEEQLLAAVEAAAAPLRSEIEALDAAQCALAADLDEEREARRTVHDAQQAEIESMHHAQAALGGELSTLEGHWRRAGQTRDAAAAREGCLLRELVQYEAAAREAALALMEERAMATERDVVRVSESEAAAREALLAVVNARVAESEATAREGVLALFEERATAAQEATLALVEERAAATENEMARVAERALRAERAAADRMAEIESQGRGLALELSAASAEDAEGLDVRFGRLAEDVQRAQAAATEQIADLQVRGDMTEARLTELAVSLESVEGKRSRVEDAIVATAGGVLAERTAAVGMALSDMEREAAAIRAEQAILAGAITEESAERARAVAETAQVGADAADAVRHTLMEALDGEREARAAAVTAIDGRLLETTQHVVQVETAMDEAAQTLAETAQQVDEVGAAVADIEGAVADTVEHALAEVDTTVHAEGRRHQIAAQDVLRHLAQQMQRIEGQLVGGASLAQLEAQLNRLETQVGATFPAAPAGAALAAQPPSHERSLDDFADALAAQDSFTDSERTHGQATPPALLTVAATPGSGGINSPLAAPGEVATLAHEPQVAAANTRVVVHPILSPSVPLTTTIAAPPAAIEAPMHQAAAAENPRLARWGSVRAPPAAEAPPAVTATATAAAGPSRTPLKTPLRGRLVEAIARRRDASARRSTDKSPMTPAPQAATRRGAVRTPPTAPRSEPRNGRSSPARALQYSGARPGSAQRPWRPTGTTPGQRRRGARAGGSAGGTGGGGGAPISLRRAAEAAARERFLARERAPNHEFLRARSGNGGASGAATPEVVVHYRDEVPFEEARKQRHRGA